MRTEDLIALALGVRLALCLSVVPESTQDRLRDYGFCRVYVSLSEQDTRGTVDEMEGPPVWCEVRHNENRPHRQEDFIYWPTCVEIAQDDDDSVDVGIVETTRRVIAAVESAGGRAVASADFEDEL